MAGVIPYRALAGYRCGAYADGACCSRLGYPCWYHITSRAQACLYVCGDDARHGRLEEPKGRCYGSGGGRPGLPRACQGRQGRGGRGGSEALENSGFLWMYCANSQLPPSFAEFKNNLPATLLEYLRRTQLTLYPLMLHLTPATPASAATARGAERSAALLRLGAPGLANRATGVGAEFRSPIAVARPGKRIGLLSIVA
jgi:hypothetical protein